MDEKEQLSLTECISIKFVTNKLKKYIFGHLNYFFIKYIVKTSKKNDRFNRNLKIML